MATITSRTLKIYRDEGFVCEKVEYWNAFSKTRKDLFGFIDIVALKKGCLGVIAIQSTSRSNISARVKKIKESKEAKLWLDSGNFIYVIGWDKKGGRWRFDKREITEKDYEQKENDIKERVEEGERDCSGESFRVL